MSCDPPPKKTHSPCLSFSPMFLNFVPDLSWQMFGCFAFRLKTQSKLISLSSSFLLLLLLLLLLAGAHRDPR